jgi:hypothetical protein
MVARRQAPSARIGYLRGFIFDGFISYACMVFYLNGFVD